MTSHRLWQAAQRRFHTWAEEQGRRRGAREFEFNVGTGKEKMLPWSFVGGFFDLRQAEEFEQVLQAEGAQTNLIKCVLPGNQPGVRFLAPSQFKGPQYYW